MILHVNDEVIIADNFRYGGRFYHKRGVIARIWDGPLDENIAVRIPGYTNCGDPYGYYYFRYSFLLPAKDSAYHSKPFTSFEIKNVIFNEPATIVFWKDGTKTVVKCGEDECFDPEKGLAMAISKKAMGNKGHYFEEFKKWTSPYYEQLDADAAAFVDWLFDEARKGNLIVREDGLKGEVKNDS